MSDDIIWMDTGEIFTEIMIAACLVCTKRRKQQKDVSVYTIVIARGEAKVDLHLNIVLGCRQQRFVAVDQVCIVEYEANISVIVRILRCVVLCCGVAWCGAVWYAVVWEAGGVANALYRKKVVFVTSHQHLRLVLH